MTSQPYASSSYGLLQFTLQPFDPVYSGDPNRAGLLNAVFNPSSTPIYNLAQYPDLNFKLTANFHNFTLNALRSSNPPILPQGVSFSPCTPTNCNESMWLQEWRVVFSFYNSKKAGYSLIVGAPTIVPNGESSYVPQ
jgi:hypothetical protein